MDTIRRLVVCLAKQLDSMDFFYMHVGPQAPPPQGNRRQIMSNNDCYNDTNGWMLGLKDHVMSMMMTVGYFNTGYDQSQGLRPSVLKRIGSLSQESYRTQPCIRQKLIRIRIADREVMVAPCGTAIPGRPISKTKTKITYQVRIDTKLLQADTKLTLSCYKIPFHRAYKSVYNFISYNYVCIQ